MQTHKFLIFAAIFLAALSFSKSLFASEDGSRAEFNVRAFGAVGDARTKDTSAIQKAINACTASGGGTVVVPPGTYLTGSIFLKNNVDFYLMPGATLLGSPDREDYNALDVCPQNHGSARESSFGAHLILCIEQKNVTLRGPGCVDGNGSKFTIDPNGVPYPAQDKIPWRVSQMVYFVECENVRVQDIELVNSSYWTSFYHGCAHVFIRGVRIRNSRHPHTHNGDGIDLDCCEYVTVSDCQIDSADDCITFRADTRDLKNPRPCRNITVTNCVLSTPCNCFRFGVGDGIAENITISNIVIEGSRTAFNFVSSWSKESRGVNIRNVRITNITLDCAIFVHMYYNLTEQAEIRDIAITNVSGTLRPVTEMTPERRDESCVWLNKPASEFVQIFGKPVARLKNIRFSDVDLRVFADGIWKAEYVDGLTLENVMLRPTVPDHPIRYDLQNVTNLSEGGRNQPEAETR